MSIAVLLVFIVAAIWVLVLAGWVLKEVAGIEASLIFTLIVGAIGWGVKSSVEKRREHQRLLAADKQSQYFEFLRILQKYIASVRSTEDLSGEEHLDELRKWNFRLLMIGSDEVIRAWTRARLSGTKADDSSESANPVVTLRVWGDLLLAMRKDCGHHNTRISVTEMLSTFINDIEAHAAKMRDD